MTFPKVMLISSTTPSDNWVAGIWTRDICSYIPTDKLSMGVILRSTVESASYPFPSQAWSLPRNPSIRSSPLQRLGLPIWMRFKAKQIAARIVRFIDEQEPDIVLMIIHGEFNILILNSVANAISQKVAALVWDPPEYVVRADKLDLLHISYQATLRSFYSLLARSQACAVMSDEMGRIYQRYTRTITLRTASATTADIIATDSELISNADKAPYTIGFAGSLYASDEFQELVNALDTVNWTIGGREVKITLIGNGIRVEAKAPTNITFLGWHPQNRVVELLRQCSLLYLPYKLSPDFATAAQLSFPTKLGTYVAAQVPVLYHGPRNSSVTEFLTRYAIGLGCHSLDHSDILATINLLLTDTSVRDTAASALKLALREEFSPEQFRQRLAELLGIDSSLLTDH